MDCGGAAPTLRGLRALPQPGAAVWPQLLFDMRYQGKAGAASAWALHGAPLDSMQQATRHRPPGPLPPCCRLAALNEGCAPRSRAAGAFTVTIEMKVDIRDAAVWEKFDQALTRFGEGGKRRPSGSSVPPSHAASAPALGGSAGAEEEEEEEPEPLSPDSSAAGLGGGGSEQGGGSPGPESPLAAERGGEGQGPERRGFMGGLRQSLAKRVRKLAETTAVHIAR